MGALQLEAKGLWQAIMDAAKELTDAAKEKKIANIKTKREGLRLALTKLDEFKRKHSDVIGKWRSDINIDKEDAKVVEGYVKAIDGFVRAERDAVLVGAAGWQTGALEKITQHHFFNISDIMPQISESLLVIEELRTPTSSVTTAFTDLIPLPEWTGAD